MSCVWGSYRSEGVVESHGIYNSHFPGLESHGIRPIKVMENEQLCIMKLYSQMCKFFHVLKSI